MKQGKPYFIDVRIVDGKRYYSYSTLTIEPFEKESTCDIWKLFGKPSKRVRISKKAWKLAALRCHPDSENEIKEIITYSEGGKIKLSFFEKVILALTHN